MNNAKLDAERAAYKAFQQSTPTSATQDGFLIWMAARSLPAQASEPVAYVRSDELAKLADPRVAGRGMMLSKEPGAGTQPIYTSATAPAQGEIAKKLAHGHRDDWYLMANARALAVQPIHEIRSMPNWVLAKHLFATGSTSAHQICVDAGIDPDGYKVERAAMSSQPGKGEA